MKKNIYLYLFIFSLLLNVFTYMYFTNKQKSEDQRIEKMQKTVKKTQDSLAVVSKSNAENGYFSLKGNDNAVDYFYGHDIDSLSDRIIEGVKDRNAVKGGNTLVGYDALDGQPWLIGNIQILNNRWLIADFSNGIAWGDVLIRYFVDDKGNVTYETMQTNLYADTVR
ncbi:MAG: hypothetical protein ACO1N9_01585 [Flavobacterium sp.]